MTFINVKSFRRTFEDVLLRGASFLCRNVDDSNEIAGTGGTVVIDDDETEDDNNVDVEVVIVIAEEEDDEEDDDEDDVRPHAPLATRHTFENFWS